jgi:dTDP-4-dehydrorhamnose reductase
VTWVDLARLAAERAGLDGSGVRPRALRSLDLAAARPRYSALATERGPLLPSLDDALSRHLRHRALAADAGAPNGQERRRSFRPWRYQQSGAWI